MTRRQLAALLGLCLWSSLGWVMGDVSSRAEAYRLALVGIVCAAMGVRSAAHERVELLWAALCGVGLFAGPSLLLQRDGVAVQPTLAVLCFSLVPVAVLMAVAIRTSRALEGASLLASLVGSGGLMVLLPVAMPASWRGWLGVGLTVVAVGWTAISLVLLPPILRRVAFFPAVAAACLASAAVLWLGAAQVGSFGRHELWVESGRALAVDLPGIALLVWLTREVAPERLAARYLITPLLTILEGYAVLRPPLDVRTIGGIVLLAGGAYGVLRARPETTLTLRG